MSDSKHGEGCASSTATRLSLKTNSPDIEKGTSSPYGSIANLYPKEEFGLIWSEGILTAQILTSFFIIKIKHDRVLSCYNGYNAYIDKVAHEKEYHI